MLIQIRADAGQALAALNATGAAVKGVGGESAATATRASGMFGALGGEMQKIGRIAVGMATGMLAANAVMTLSARFDDAAKQIDIFGRAVLQVQRISGESAEGASLLVAMFQRFSPSADVAATRLARFEKNLAGQEDALEVVSNGGKTAAAVLTEFGVVVNDTTGHLRPTTDILMDLADGFSHSTDAAAKMQALTALFGRGSQDMLLMLNQGRAGLEAFAADAKKYGLILSQDNVNDVAAFIKAHKQMDQALQGVALQLGAAFMPAITEASQGVARFAQLLNQSVMPVIRAIPGAMPAILVAVGLLATAFGVQLAASAVKATVEVVKWAATSSVATAKAAAGMVVAATTATVAFLRMAAASAASAVAMVAQWLAAAGPVVLVVGAIAIALGAVALAASGKMAEAKDAIAEAFNQIGTAVQAGIRVIEDGFGSAGSDAGKAFVDGLDSESGAAESAGLKLAKAAKDAADSALKTFSDSADTRKNVFDQGHVDAETNVLQSKLDANQAEHDTLDLKQQIEDLDRNAIDYSQKRLELDQQDAVTKAKLAADSLKNNQDDLTYQEQLLTAQVKAARARGEHVDMHAVRAEMKDLKTRELEGAPAVLIAEHNVSLADRAKTATDLNGSLKATNLERQKLALQEQLAPLEAAAILAKRQSDEIAYQLDVAKQWFAIDEQKYALEKLQLEAMAKEKDLAVWMIEHPVAGTAGAAAPAAASAPGPQYGPAPVTSAVTVGEVHIHVQGGDATQGQALLDDIKDKIGDWFRSAVQQLNTDHAPSSTLGGNYAT